MSQPITIKVWWIAGAAVLAIVAIAILVRALGAGGSENGSMSRDQLVARSLTALFEEDVDRLEALSLPPAVRVKDCSVQDSAEVRKRIRGSHREAIRQLRRYMDTKDLQKANITLVRVEADPEPTRYRTGSPAMGARGEECRYTRDLTVHRLRADIRVNGEIEDEIRVAAIELDGAWYLGDFLLGGVIMDDRDPF